MALGVQDAMMYVDNQRSLRTQTVYKLESSVWQSFLLTLPPSPRTSTCDSKDSQLIVPRRTSLSLENRQSSASTILVCTQRCPYLPKRVLSTRNAFQLITSREEEEEGFRVWRSQGRVSVKCYEVLREREREMGQSDVTRRVPPSSRMRSNGSMGLVPIAFQCVICNFSAKYFSSLSQVMKKQHDHWTKFSSVSIVDAQLSV